MNEETVLKKIIEIFSTMTEVEDISADSELIDDLELSSIDVL